MWLRIWFDSLEEVEGSDPWALAFNEEEEKKEVEVKKWVRFWTAKSSKKSAFFRTKKSAFAKKSTLESAFFSAKKMFSYRKG